MATAVALPPSGLSAVFCSRRSRKGKKFQADKERKEPKRLLPYPKSVPTPLIIRAKPQQSKLQALNGVIKEIQESMKKGVFIEPQIVSSLLETCYKLNALDEGVKLHQLLPSSLIYKNSGISGKLVRLYASCGLVEEAHEVFDQMPERGHSAFPWNSLIAGYSEMGLYEDALALYFQMEEECVAPDEFTFPRVLKACGGVGVVGVGEAVHRDVIRLGFGSNIFVQNALVDMYSKCGDIVKARKVFASISCKDSVSWNTMLNANFRHGLYSDALQVFRQMITEGVEPDSVAISTILSNLSFSPKLGIEIQGWATRKGMNWDLSVANSLITMYSNNKKLVKARYLFDHMPVRDLVTWNSIIQSHRNDPLVFTYLEAMEEKQCSPDAITFVLLLSSCAHLGLVDEAERLFSLMKGKYSISPSMEHYACMVNAYGRAGMVDKAYRTIIEEMDIEAGPTVWGALLYSCFLHKNVDIAEIASQKVFDLEPDNELNFELLMKIYADAGRLKDEERVRKMISDRGL